MRRISTAGRLFKQRTFAQKKPLNIKQKHIGIVSVSTVGAFLCANKIVLNATKSNKFKEHPEFTIHALPFDRYKTLAIDKDWSGMADTILHSISVLEKAGSDFVIIPSNAPHFGIDEIKEKSPLPVLNMLDIVIEKCVNLKLKSPAVLGTSFVMEGGLYDPLLKKQKISPLLLDKKTRDMIHSLIMDEIIPDQIKETSVNALVDRLKSFDADAMILGCTELPKVLNENNLGVRVLDTTDLMAEAALEYATCLESNIKPKSSDGGWNWETETFSCK